MKVTDEFVEYASEGSLAIEVWGNRMKGFDSQNKVMLNWNVEPQQKGLHDRYQTDVLIFETKILQVAKLIFQTWHWFMTCLLYSLIG